VAFVPITHRAFFLIDRNRVLSFIAFCATAPRVRRSFFAAWALARKLRSSNEEHIFVRFAKQAQDSNGVTVDTFYPEGLSGGALLDLGDFTSPSIYQGDTKLRARLAGMIIEYHGKKYRALVAVKVRPILSGIRNALRCSLSSAQ